MEKQPPLRRQEESGRFVPTCQGPGLRPTTEQSDLPWDRDAGRGTPSPFPHHTWDTLWEEGEKGGHTQALEPWRWGGRGRGSVLSPLPATAPTPHSGAEVTAAGDPLGWEQCEDRVSHVEGLQKHLRSSFGGVGGMRNTESPTEAGRTRFAFSDLKRPFPDWGWKHPRGWKTGYFIGLHSRTLLNPNPNLLDKEALAGAWGALCDWHPAQDVCS